MVLSFPGWLHCQRQRPIRSKTVVFVLAELVFAVVSLACSAPALNVVNVAHVAWVCVVPLSMAVVATTKRNKSHRPVTSQENENVPRGKYGQGYTPEDLQRAVAVFLKANKNAGTKKKKGARKNDVKLGTIRSTFLREEGVSIPYQILKDVVQRATQENKVIVSSGPAPQLSREGEDQLIKHCDAMAGVALTPDKHYVMWLAGYLGRLAGRPFRNKDGTERKEPSEGWRAGFKKRWPSFGLKSTQSLERNRATAVDAWAIHRFFDKFEQVLGMRMDGSDLSTSPDPPPGATQSSGGEDGDNSALDEGDTAATAADTTTLDTNTYRSRADRVGNLDESGFQGTVRPTKAFAMKGKRAQRLTSSDNRETETLVSTSVANGDRPPPIFLFLGQGTKWNIMEHAPEGSGHKFMGDSAY